MKFLVINDDPVLPNIIKQVQADIPLSVIYANSSREGITLARLQQPNLILISYTLDEMTGIEVCAVIRQFCSAPIFIISALDDPSIMITALDAGADDYLVKPISARVLEAKIHATIRRFVTHPLTPYSIPS
jgi:DNA-binding response OmpR family regulator